jgi:hypothetical protein
MLNYVNITSNPNVDERPGGLNNKISVSTTKGPMQGYGHSHEFGHLMGMGDHYCRDAKGCGRASSFSKRSLGRTVI